MSFDTLSKQLIIPSFSYRDIVCSKVRTDQVGTYGIVLDSSSFAGLWSRLVFLLFKKFVVSTKVAELKNNGIPVTAVLSVYPDAAMPLIIFNQSAKAEQYCLDNILPKIDWSLVGIIKRLLFISGKVHPSVNSFVLIVGTSDKFQQVNTMLLGLKFNAQQDFLCITTSNPVFLSFSNNSAPDYVLHNANKGDFVLRQEIYQTLPSLVAKPLAEINKDEQCFFVESGLPGKPWFQLLKDKTITMDEIKKRSLLTLQEFSQKVKNHSPWICQVNVVDLFKQQFEQSHKIRQFNKNIVNGCSELLKTLPSQYLVQGTWQHGDYCINNLIFAEDRTYVIDFEGFGDTHMPLQDEFSLALSFYIQRDVQTLDLLEEDLTYCLQHTDKTLNHLLPILFVYHLLFKLGKWGENANRTSICDWLQNILIEYTERLCRKDHISQLLN